MEPIPLEAVRRISCNLKLFNLYTAAISARLGSFRPQA
jgi:hypothetical protein